MACAAADNFCVQVEKARSLLTGEPFDPPCDSCKQPSERRLEFVESGIEKTAVQDNRIARGEIPEPFAVLTNSCFTS